jgi:hypothetical protein
LIKPYVLTALQDKSASQSALAAKMSQNEQPFGPSHPVESSSAATVPSGNAASGNTSDEQYKPLAIPTQHQQEVPITDTTPGVSDLQRPEPALLPPPTQLSTAEDEDDGDVPTSAAALTPGASVNITLLLTTGARHPFTIDQKYLKKRNVAPGTEEVDPFQISVYTMKELIWRDWREGMSRVDEDEHNGGAGY